MQPLIDALERLPVATLAHLFVVAILGVDLVVNGNLSSDALTYAGIAEGGNIGVAASRAHVAAAKVNAGVTAPADPSGADGDPVLDLADAPPPLDVKPDTPPGEPVIAA